MKSILLSVILLCGLVPLKPLTPLGCKDLISQCVCDSSGQNCYYIWVCVK